MITSFQLQNFKGHRDTTIPLGRFNVLVGPNGAGKSSVLQALALQSQLVSQNPGAVLTGDSSPHDLMQRNSSGPIVLSSSGRSPPPPWKLKFEMTLLSSTSWSLDYEWHQAGDPRRYNNMADAVQIYVPEVGAAMGSAVLYKLNARSIAAAAYSDQPEPKVAFDGTDTAVVLAALKLGQDEEFMRIEEELRGLIPNVERVRVKRAYVQRQVPPNIHLNAKLNFIGNKVFFDFRDAPGVPAHAASDGTLIMLALLTVLHGPTRPNILLLDDFDQSLHPKAQMELVKQLRRLLDQFTDLQIVATTHSPYILDELDPSEIHVCALRQDGSVAVKRLSEHPQAEKMKGMLSAGQLWTLDPEKDWVVEEKST